MANTLQILIEILSKQEGLDAAVAQARALNAEGEQSVATAIESAKAQEKIALQMERRIIAETQIEAAEARISGNSKLAVNLEREADIRQRALGIQNALNVTTEESIVLAEKMVLAQEEGAASTLLSGANLNKAKGEAIVLARELATGSLNARTMGAFLGSLGTSLTIGALVGYELYQVVSHAADEALRLNQEVEKSAGDLQKAVSQWIEISNAAGASADVVKLGEKIQPELDKAAEQLQKFRDTQLTLWQKFVDLLPPLQPFDAQGKEVPEDQNRANLEGATARQAQITQQALTDANLSVEIAQRAQAAWEAVKLEPLSQAVADYTEKLEALRVKQAGIDRNASIPDFEKWVAVGREIEETSRRVDLLTSAQNKLAADTERVSAAIAKANFSQLDPADKLKAFDVEIFDIQDQLLRLGVDAASPNEALEKAKGLSGDIAAEVVRLAGAWAQVGVAIAAALGEEQKMAGQLQTFQDKLSVTNAQAFGTRDEAFNAEWGARYNQVLEQRKSIGADISAQAINEQIYAEQTAATRRKEWAELDRGVSGHRDIVAFTREESSLLENIRQQQQLIDANVRLGPEEKNATTIENIRQEIVALNAEAEKGRGLLAGGTLDPATYEQVAGKVQKTTFEVALLNEKLDKLQHPIFASLSDWVQQLGTAAQQVGKAITGSINTALDASANALTDIIFRTGDWRQTMLQAEKQIVGSLIKIGLQMLVQWALSKIITRSTTQDQVQAGGQIAAAHAPAAAATSISTSGSAAIIGAIAAAAAIALIIGLLAGGFEGGGYTGDKGTRQIAGVVHGKEFVHDDPTVRRYGLPVMEAMRRGVIPPERIQELLGNYRYPVTPRFGSFEVGGAVAAIESSSNDRATGGGGSGPVTIKGFKTVVLNDVAKLRKELFDSDEAVVFVIDAITGNAHLVKGAIASS